MHIPILGMCIYIMHIFGSSVEFIIKNITSVSDRQMHTGNKTAGQLELKCI